MCFILYLSSSCFFVAPGLLSTWFLRCELKPLGRGSGLFVEKDNISTLQRISSLLLATPWSSYVNLILSSWHTPTPRRKKSELAHSDDFNSIQLVAWDSFKLAIPPAKQLVWSPWCHSPGMDISSVPNHRKVASGISGLRTKGAAWTDASQADDLWVRNHAWIELEQIWMKSVCFLADSV